jgi:hypothetical protein
MLADKLRAFASSQSFRTKGGLSVALVVTDHARRHGLPLDDKKLTTKSDGQVLGLGKSAVQAILRRHAIDKVLAKEGGRTSRGSIKNMKAYCSFLNCLFAEGLADLDRIEEFWIARVRDFFAAKPFLISLDASRSLRTMVRSVIEEADARQRESPGVQYAGAMMQHLVGAKLDCALGRRDLVHHSFSTADAPTSRAADFLIEDVAIHVTNAPTESMIRDCQGNIDAGFRAVVVTRKGGVAVAEGLAANAGIADRIDIFEIEQFIALNLYELSAFARERRRAAVDEVVTRYNEIVDQVETDPSLRIELRP